MLDNRYALLFIRGELPVMDEKYDILKHPNIALTEDGAAAPYEHGGTETCHCYALPCGNPHRGHSVRYGGNQNPIMSFFPTRI